MAEEIESHKQNGTWEICCLLTGRKAISSKWVFKIKYTADGSVEKYKALGWLQKDVHKKKELIMKKPSRPSFELTLSDYC